MNGIVEANSLNVATQQEDTIDEHEYIVGLDLGQARDFTAVAVLDKTMAADPLTPHRPQSHYVIRHAQRWPLGTPYTTIVKDVVDLVSTPPLSNPLMAADMTGVGMAVMDMLRQAQIPARLYPILITSGHSVTGSNGCLHVPKKELAAGLIVLNQSRRLQMAAMPEREILARELAAFRVKITAAGNETFESWRQRDHDDLVLAVALAIWLGEHRVEPYRGPLVLNAPWPGDVAEAKPEPSQPPKAKSRLRELAEDLPDLRRFLDGDDD